MESSFASWKSLQAAAPYFRKKAHVKRRVRDRNSIASLGLDLTDGATEYREAV
jgi:hypothetical protein